jgi:hypothetical protein
VKSDWRLDEEVRIGGSGCIEFKKEFTFSCGMRKVCAPGSTVWHERGQDGITRGDVEGKK